jgi:Zn-dependent peptidase ImmA (M78 family)
MALISKARHEAQKLLEEIGVEDIADIPMDLLAAGLNATLIEEPLKCCDGRITFSANRSLIKINSNIPYVERKRFVAAHEIGHHRLHKNMDLPPDTAQTLNFVEGAEKQLKTGKQELEANQFAAELLMPTKAFLARTKSQRFSPQLLHDLAQHCKRR